MKTRLGLCLPVLAVLLLPPSGVRAQSGGAGKLGTETTAKVVITGTTTPQELARAAFLAQGGEKFRNLKSMILSGTVDLYAPNSVQSLPGKFVVVNSGERQRVEIQSPVFNFRQISNGDKSFTSVKGMEFPSLNKTGINALMKYDRSGYAITAIADDKKLRGFRITDPEGYATDFYVDAANGRVVRYMIPYQGYKFGVENSSLKEINGVLVPYAFSQRMETPQGAFFAEYKVKDVKLDVEIEDNVFDIPEQ
jgi:hypothetical protein